MQRKKNLLGKIFVFRHGETTDNKRKIFSGMFMKYSLLVYTFSGPLGPNSW